MAIALRQLYKLMASNFSCGCSTTYGTVRDVFYCARKKKKENKSFSIAAHRRMVTFELYDDAMSTPALDRWRRHFIPMRNHYCFNSTLISLPMIVCARVLAKDFSDEKPGAIYLQMRSTSIEFNSVQFESNSSAKMMFQNKIAAVRRVMSIASKWRFSNWIGITKVREWDRRCITTQSN